MHDRKTSFVMHDRKISFVMHDRKTQSDLLSSFSFKFCHIQTIADTYSSLVAKFSSGPQPQKQQRPKSKRSALIWAIPVTLVVLILIVALVVMVTKYRSLQRSFMAFANRGYSRAEEEDDDVAVSFHQGQSTLFFSFLFSVLFSVLPRCQHQQWLYHQRLFGH